MIVETTYGKIRGVNMGEYVEYRGIPYAQPPVGNLRWKAPRPMEQWKGIYEADTFQNIAMQETMEDSLYTKEFYSNPEFIRQKNEDCLYLNIWMPKNSSDKKLPVAFWIHGGAFMGGYSSELEFDGEAYCKRNVILVTVEYRCNIFGFLAHPWLSEENESGISGNYGILDQIAALQWVYENIASFGGDAENITVFGQSAGAMSVQTLVSSPLTGNMISKAIMQSGGGYANGLNRDDITLHFQEEMGVLFSETAEVENLEQMRKLSAEKILELTGTFLQKAMPKAKGLFLVPTIDGHVLEEGYNARIDHMKIKDIPYLLGSTADDLLVSPELKKEGKNSSLYTGCVEFSKKLEEAGRSPAWVYYFARELPGDSAGAFHSSELWYMFGTLHRCWRPMKVTDEELSQRILDYWTNFMKYGNPNGDELPKWEPCDCKSENVLRLDI